MNDKYTSSLAKQESVKNFFCTSKTPQAVYEKLIELGRALPPLALEMQTEENLVSGCQSRVYLHAELVNGKIQFQIGADALISAGLAALLLAAYNHEAPEAILSCPPTFLEDLGIQTALTPGRSHGLASIHLRMKQEAVKFLVTCADK